MKTPFTFGIVDAGWRAVTFVRLARLLSDQPTLVGASVPPFGSCRTIHPAVGRPRLPVFHGTGPPPASGLVISCVPSSANLEVVTSHVCLFIPYTMSYRDVQTCHCRHRPGGSTPDFLRRFQTVSLMMCEAWPEGQPV